MELVLVGLPGSGKTAVGRRLAALRDAEFVDLDAAIEAGAGKSIPDIFADHGEAAFRAHESAAIAALGPPDQGHRLTRIIATGGGAVVAPRNRWQLFRGRRLAWLDADDAVLVRRLRRSAVRRPLLEGREPLEALAELRARRQRFYAAAPRVAAHEGVAEAIAALEPLLRGSRPAGVRLLDATTPVGRVVLGEGCAAGVLAEALDGLGARRLALLSEPLAWRLHGEALTAGVTRLARDAAVEPLLLPRGERAKTLRVLERVTRELARRHQERGEPIVAMGGGAVGDTAGFTAAVYLRGVPLVHLPTTLLAQLDASLGGKTGLDLPEGKNLVGAFYPPLVTVLDTAFLATLPVRQRRAALAEAVKMALLGDEALFALLEKEGPDLARGDPAATASGALTELVERTAWAKLEVVARDPHERGERIALNLGHSLAHGIEAAAGYRGILHGEAVAHGLRGALAIGETLGVTPHDRAERGRALLDELGLGRRAPRVNAEAVLEHLGADKKVRAGRLRWVLASAEGWAVRADVPESAVQVGLAAALAAGPHAGRARPAIAARRLAGSAA